ncbi:Neoverrucotoxin subunit beta [Nymphon striatum]|nr:Neoverrucotoxin subunit beta [Nymphon striatum]
MATTVLYILPMLLGRTYNETSSAVGIDIFPQSAIDQAKIIPRQFSEAKYKVIKSVQDARDFLDISGELSLKIKAGMLKVKGTGGYLKDSKSREEYVEILAKAHVESRTITLRSNSKPYANWFLESPSVLGTHYVRSISYGGDLIASIKFKVKNSSEKEKIAATIDASLNIGGSFSGNVKGKFDKLQERLKSSTSLEIKFYATVNLQAFPTTIDELIDLVKGFPDQLKIENGGTGIPIRAELVPLSHFRDSYPEFLRNAALESSLNDLENKFDDVRSAIYLLDEWSVKLRGLSESQERKISDFNTKLQRLQNVFIDVIATMDVSVKGNRQQFKPALDMYLAGGFNLPSKYFKMFQKAERRNCE